MQCEMNCAIIHVLICMRPEMAMKFGFPKRTDDWTSGRNSKPEGFTVQMNSDTKIKLFEIICLVE